MHPSKKISGSPASILFSVYSDNGEDQLVVSLGSDVTLMYNTLPDETVEAISFDINVADGNWHRLGFSIKGDTVTLIADQDRQITRELRRDTRIPITTNGIVIIGQQLVDGNLYLVRIINKFCPCLLFFFHL